MFMYLSVLCLLLSSFAIEGIEYNETWESLDARPIPTWYDDAKIGIFIHWGVFSVPSYQTEWFWKNWERGRKDIVDFMKRNYPPGFTYQEFAPGLTGEFFNASQWAEIFQNSGAQYIIFTSKHHEGFAMWPSKYSYSWNSFDIGPKRDVIGELAEAIRNETDLHFGLYHSLYEWFHPLYLADKENNFTTQIFVDQKIIPEMKELIFKYEPEIIWSDGEWEAPDTYWRAKQFISWLYNESPVKDTIVVNDRWGSNTLCKHGGFMTCADRYNPGILQARKWENALTIDKESWGFRREADLKDFYTSKELIQFIAEAVSCNGNVALNVGPTKDGVISPIYQERLADIGQWLKINGEAIYKSRPWSVCQNDTTTPHVWYTIQYLPKGHIELYAIVLNWPTDGKIALGCPFLRKTYLKVTMLGSPEPLEVELSDFNLVVTFPNKVNVSSDLAWTLKITSPDLDRSENALIKPEVVNN